MKGKRVSIIQAAMRRSFGLCTISEERGVLIGIATVAVMIFHSYSLHFEEIFASAFLCDIFNYIQSLGNIGVDIFLFVSAFGLYYSFSKDSNIKNFYTKRVLRIIPSAVIIAAIYYLYVGTAGIVDFVKKVLLLAFFESNNRDFWFLSFILIMYIVFPLLYKVVESYKGLGVASVIAGIVLVNILLMVLTPELYGRLEIALTRIPIFIVGIYFGRMAKRDEKISVWWILAAFVTFIATNIMLYNCHFDYYCIVRYMYGLWTVSFVIVVCFINSVAKKRYGINGAFAKFFAWIGMYSLEIYLIYEKLALMLRKTKVVNIGSSTVYYIVILGLTLTMAMMLKQINKGMIKLRA